MVTIRFDRALLNHPGQVEKFLTSQAKKTVLDNINQCVLKVYFKKKFIFVKGKTAIGALKCVFRAMQDYSGQKSVNLPEDNLNLHFVKYFWNETRGWTFRVKVIDKRNSAFQLLMTEQKLLWEHQKDENCLNNTIDAYIPVFRGETKSYGWLSWGGVAAFLKWKKKNNVWEKTGEEI